MRLMGKNNFISGKIKQLGLFYMTHKTFWVDVLELIQPTIKKANFITWFKDTNVVSNLEGVITVAVPNAYAKGWLETKYAMKVMDAVKKIDNDVSEIKYVVDLTISEKGDGVDVKKVFSKKFEKKVRKVRNANEVKIKGIGKRKTVFSKMLNERYSLDNFVVSHDNRLAHAASEAVVKVPGGIYNPLYIYGNVGMGKTHLMQAIGNGILNDSPDLVVKYITAERFVTEVVEAIGKRHMKTFKQKFRNVDCLLIDDIQFFANKTSSQQELFYTFNELYECNKQIVFTSDRAPSELCNLDERLKSRFEMGMVVELVMPDFESKMAILQQKSNDFGLVLDPDVLSFIASNVDSSVRALEGVLRQVVAESNLFNALPTIDSVARIIQRMDKAREIIGYDFQKKHKAKTRLKVEDLIKMVADYYDVTVDELTGKCRKKEVMVPRQVSIYLIKTLLGRSYEQIGVNFGGRNHTTIMHSYKKIAKLLSDDVALMKDVNSIRRILQ